MPLRPHAACVSLWTTYSSELPSGRARWRRRSRRRRRATRCAAPRRGAGSRLCVPPAREQARRILARDRRAAPREVTRVVAAVAAVAAAGRGAREDGVALVRRRRRRQPAARRRASVRLIAIALAAAAAVGGVFGDAELAARHRGGGALLRSLDGERARLELARGDHRHDLIEALVRAERAARLDVPAALGAVVVAEAHPALEAAGAEAVKARRTHRRRDRIEADRALDIALERAGVGGRRRLPRRQRGAALSDGLRAFDDRAAAAIGVGSLALFFGVELRAHLRHRVVLVVVVVRLVVLLFLLGVVARRHRAAAPAAAATTAMDADSAADLALARRARAGPRARRAARRAVDVRAAAAPPCIAP